MIEKILKDTYVNPKVELTQTDYNRLVQTAQMKAKKSKSVPANSTRRRAWLRLTSLATSTANATAK